MQGKKEIAVTFLLSFLITALLLAAVVTIAFTTSNVEDKTALTNVSSEKKEYLPVYEHDQNILVILCEWRGGKALLFGVFKINAIKRCFNLCVLPPDIVSTVNIRTDTLAGHYDYGGSLMAMEAVQNACGIKINRYIRIGSENAVTFIDSFGGIEFDVKDSAPGINKGFQTLDGRRILALIEGQKDSLKQARLAGEIFSKFVNDSLKDAILENSQEVFSKITKLSDTTLSAFDFEYRKEAIDYICREKKPCKTVFAAGEYIPEEEWTELSETTITDLQSAFWLNSTSSDDQ